MNEPELREIFNEEGLRKTLMRKIEENEGSLSLDGIVGLCWKIFMVGYDTGRVKPKVLVVRGSDDEVH